MLPPPPPPEDDAGVTVTGTDWVIEPPGPVQLSIKVALEPRETAVLPLTAWGPVHPEAPLAAHVVVFCELQVSCTVVPRVTDEGAAVKVKVGGAEAILSP